MPLPKRLSPDERAVLAEIKVRAPSPDRMNTVTGADYPFALRLAKAGFLGIGHTKTGDQGFWFITDDPAKAVPDDLSTRTCLQTVILTRDIPQKSGAPANFFLLRVPEFESGGKFAKRLRWAMRRLGLARKDFSALDGASGDWKSGDPANSRFVVIEATGDDALSKP